MYGFGKDLIGTEFQFKVKFRQASSNNIIPLSRPERTVRGNRYIFTVTKRFLTAAVGFHHQCLTECHNNTKTILAYVCRG